jgi:hypothetical protein
MTFSVGAYLPPVLKGCIMKSVTSARENPAQGHAVRDAVKKWIVTGLVLLILGGCSWKSVRDWMDKVEWERSDETIRIIDIFIR